MRIYQIDYGQKRDGDGDGGASYCGSLREARAVRRATREWAPNAEIKPIDFKPTKAGIIEILNQYAGHPDNG